MIRLANALHRQKIGGQVGPTEGYGLQFLEPNLGICDSLIRYWGLRALQDLNTYSSTYRNARSIVTTIVKVKVAQSPANAARL